MLDFEDFAVWCGNFNPQNKNFFRCFMNTSKAIDVALRRLAVRHTKRSKYPKIDPQRFKHGHSIGLPVNIHCHKAAHPCSIRLIRAITCSKVVNLIFKECPWISRIRCLNRRECCLDGQGVGSIGRATTQTDCLSAVVVKVGDVLPLVEDVLSRTNPVQVTAHIMIERIFEDLVVSFDETRNILRLSKGIEWHPSREHYIDQHQDFLNRSIDENIAWLVIGAFVGKT